MTWQRERARVASLSRSRTTDDPELLGAKRDLRAALMEEYVRKSLAAAPPLTDEQRERLALLFAPATATHSGGAAA